MIGSTRTIRVFAYPRPADLRRGYDGLFGLVSELGEEPLSGDYFLFVNERRNRAKVLLWDGTGLCIYMKRLEQGRFAALWSRKREGRIVLTPSELALFLEGCREVGSRPLSPPQFQKKPLAEEDRL